MAVREASTRLPIIPRNLPMDRVVIPCAHARLIYRGRPLVMGILNVTPDSFSDGGMFHDPDAAVRQGLQMASDGADLIDIGGESTRPGAKPVTLEEELVRVLPVIGRLAKMVRIPLSIDTSKAEVAARAIEAGASIVNDVTALRGDPRMADVVAHSGAAVILMHMRGTPRTMQRQPRYKDVVTEVRAWLRDAAAHAQKAGIDRASIILDPGLGFGKTVRHNLELMGSLSRFTSLEYPILIGPSRKSFIGKTLKVDVNDRLVGTLACVAEAARCGIQLIRVHDVQPTVQLLQMLQAIDHAHSPRR